MFNLIMQSGAAPAGSAFAQIIPLILIFVIFYVFLIMPQQRRMKQHRQMLSEIVRGDVVVTNGGLIGKVKKAGDDELTVDLGGAEVKVVRSMIADVRSKTAPANDTGKGGKKK